MITLEVPKEYADLLIAVFCGVRPNAVESRTVLHPLICQIKQQLEENKDD
jgi:hypothetical protein